MIYRACVNKCKSWKKYFVILGGIFIYLPIGVPWYFGNLATYINSYYHAKTPADMDLVDPQWIFSAFFITFSLAIIASGYISNMYGPRFTVLIALIVHSGATFVSYYAIQHSMIALITVFGALGGLGAGLAYGPPLPVVIKWIPYRIGLASGALMTGFGGGAVFYNEIITFFINPDNKKPDVTGPRTKYFSDPDILRRTEEIFLVLGGLTVVLQLIGIWLLRLPEDGDEIEKLQLQETTPIVAATNARKHSDDIQNRTDTDGAAVLDINPPSENETTSIKDIRNADMIVNMTPREVLKSSDFYILWLVLAFNHYGYIIKNNYYKEFGQLRIDDDHFLTTVGTISTIGVSVARLFWGLATDWLGTKLTLMVFSSFATVITSFWYFSLFHSPGMYMLAIILVSMDFTGAFILIPLAAIRCFGETHYASNYGLILSSQIVLNLISPPIIREILLHFGWFWLFFSIGVVNAFGTIALLFLRGTR
uniref:Major facilitator superfamily (MFS) profile domain-containing protein n=1 Tax=Arion vulgaris TaxID=1028688 RepID=A0A0B7A7E1_9EUPU